MRNNFTADADVWFWSRVTRTDGCWPWTGPVHHAGYGVVKWNGQQWHAHRVAYFLTYGPPRLDVLHRCGNPVCCNPTHLYDGDDKQNAADRDHHGRTAHLVGERNPQAKLTRGQIESIRASTEPAEVLAQQYGVSKWHIWRLKRNERWQQ